MTNKNNYFGFLVLIIVTGSFTLFIINKGYFNSNQENINQSFSKETNNSISLDSSQLNKPIETKEKDKIRKGLYISRQVKNDNDSSQNALLTTKFASGTSSPIKIKNYFTKTDYGYVLDLKNKSQVISPTIHNDKLYVSGGFGSKSYFSFNANTGKLDWGASISDDGPSSCAIKDSIIIFNTESCTIFALNAKTGKHVWSKWMGDPMMSTPTISKDFVYTIYPKHHFTITDTVSKKKHSSYTKNATHVIVCINIHSGKIVWQRWIDGDAITAPIASGTNIYITTFTGTIYKFNRTNGEILAANNIRATSPPTVSGKNIFLAVRSDVKDTVYESIAVLNKYSLKVQKTFLRKKAPYLDHRIQAKTLYSKKAKAMDANNGFIGGAPITANAVKAKKNVGYSNVSSLQSFIGSAVLVSGDRLYTSMGDELICFTSNGIVLWRYKIEGDIKKEGGSLITSPIITANKVLIVTLEGKLKIFNKNTGGLLYEEHIKTQVRNSPVVNKGWVYIPTTSGRIACVNTKIKHVDGWGTVLGNFERNINN